MAQNLAAALFKNYTPLLDEAYKLASLTAKLDTADDLVRYTSGAHEVIVQKMTLQGLADYDRVNGYVAGEVSLANESIPFNYERGRMFVVDNMDNEETAGVAYGRLAGEFLRSYVVPEIDAVRFAAYAANKGNTADDAAIAEGGWYKKVSAAWRELTENEVPENDRHLFITAAGYEDIMNMDTIKAKTFFDQCASVTIVPQSRFYETVKLTANGAGGYARETGANNINFELIHKPAVIQVLKHQDAKVIRPEDNQTADAWKFGYRVYGLNDVYENKVKGIYVSTSNVTA